MPAPAPAPAPYLRALERLADVAKAETAREDTQEAETVASAPAPDRCECGPFECYVGGGEAPDECSKGYSRQPEFIAGRRWLPLDRKLIPD